MGTTVYKVVQNTWSGLWSVFARESFMVEYKQGERVERPNIFVFAELEAAQAYSTRGYWEVWEAETESTPRPAPDRVPDYGYVQEAGYEELIRGFWEGTDLMFWADVLHTNGSPRGTYLVDDVTLIKKVPNWEGETE